MMPEQVPNELERVKTRLFSSKAVVAIVLFAAIISGMATFTNSIQTLWGIAVAILSRVRSSAGTTVKTSQIPTAAPAAPSAHLIDCRYLIIGPGDGIFNSNRNLLIVQIDRGEYLPVELTTRRWWFWEKRRSAAMFVMKSYDQGTYSVYVRTNWRLGTSGLSGEHDHIGNVILDGEHTHYLVMPRDSQDTVNLGIPLMITPLSENETTRYLEQYELSTPRCSSFKSGVSMVD